jgi:hypothetical protein
MKKISSGAAHESRHASIADGIFTARLFFDDEKQCVDNTSRAPTGKVATGDIGSGTERDSVVACSALSRD